MEESNHSYCNYQLELINLIWDGCVGLRCAGFGFVWTDNHALGEIEIVYALRVAQPNTSLEQLYITTMHLSNTKNNTSLLITSLLI